MKQGRILVEAGKPLRFQDVVDTHSLPTTVGQREAARIADVLKAYRTAASELLKGRYACFAEIAPRHLRNPCDIFILRCSDAVFVRYDVTGEAGPKVRAGEVQNSLCDFAPQLSENVVHFGTHAEDVHPAAGLRLVLTNTDNSGAQTDVMTMRLVVLIQPQLPEGFQAPLPPARPPCLASIQNEVDIQLGGHIESAADPMRRNAPDIDKFIVHARIQLSVGWQAIEVYPLVDQDYWQPEHASLWAEMDILASAAQRNGQTAQLHALDSRAETRKRYAALLDQFEGLLKSPEGPVHDFLRQHPELLCPTFDKYWSKLSFGARACDFVFRMPSNEYEIVELEAPGRRLFRRDGQQHQELTHAIDQIHDWIRYIEDNKRTVEYELGLHGISTSPRTLVVIGRSQELTADDRRKVTTLQNQYSKLRVLTYDDVVARARASIEHLLGPLILTSENAQVYVFK